MRKLLCRLVVLSAAAALVLFNSCERHKPDALPQHGDHGDHKKGDDHGHDHAHEGHDHANEGNRGDHSHAPGVQPHTHQVSTPPPAGTPPQFFPNATPAAAPTGSPR